MLTRQERKQFEKDGYLLIPGVLTPEQVRSLREFFKPKFNLPPDQRAPGDSYGDDRHKNYRLYDIYNRYPELRWLLFHERVLTILKSLLGEDCVEIPECSVALNSFGGWHKDTSSLERAGYRIHYRRDFLMVGLAYYLQDNTEEYGGGLDVEPGSHREPRDKYIEGLPRPGLARRAWRKLGRVVGLGGAGSQESGANRVVSIPSRAGDLVIFRFRLNHRATLAQQPVLPEGREKIAIFDTFSRNRPYVREYLDFMHGQGGWEYLPYISYQSDFLEQAKAAGVGLALEGYARPESRKAEETAVGVK